MKQIIISYLAGFPKQNEHLHNVQLHVLCRLTNEKLKISVTIFDL